MIKLSLSHRLAVLGGCFAVAVVLSGCHSMTPRCTRDVQDDGELRGIVLEHVPVGSTTEKAQDFLESEGFQIMTAAAQVVHNPTQGGPRETMLFRRQSNQDGAAGDSVSNVCDITVHTVDDRVVDVQASHWLLEL